MPRKHYKVLAQIVLFGSLAAVTLLSPPAYAQDGSGDATLDLTVHVVQPGETLQSISELYAVAPQSLLEANGLAFAVDVYTGQRLVIPPTEGALRTTQITVGLGDTLANLARRYDISSAQLGQSNRIVNPGLLYAGQVLNIPAGQRQRLSQFGLAKVDAGNSLWQIAVRTNQNPAAIFIQNHLTNPYLLAPGRVISIPDETDGGAVLSAPWASISLHPLPLVAGQSGSLRVEAAVSGSLSADFMGQTLPLSIEGPVNHSILSVNRWTAPGLYPLSITLQDETGAQYTYSRQVLVVAGDYAQENVRLSEEDSSVLSDSQGVQDEYAYITQIMSGYTSERFWDGLFRLPTTGVMISAFGTARSYNGGGVNSFHGGTDFVAPVSTPVFAPADGVVVDSGELTVRGFFTVIDHGWGVYTGYWHQSSILVNPGDTVVTGQQIGAVGNTGLSTAAHLHWEMWVGGNQVDPLQWAREVFP